MNRRRLLHVTATALAASVAGCGGGDGDGTEQPTDDPADTQAPTATPASTETPGDSTPTASPTQGDDSTPTPDETDAPTDSPTATETQTPTETPRDAAQVVEVGPDASLQFAPESFEVSTGDTVVWVWRGGGHNVRVNEAPSGTDWEGTPGGGSDTYDAGYEHSHTFSAAGEYEYYCAPHRSAGMEGSFTVTE